MNFELSKPSSNENPQGFILKLEYFTSESSGIQFKALELTIRILRDSIENFNFRCTIVKTVLMN
jgi:hypothetical protein